MSNTHTWGPFSFPVILVNIVRSWLCGFVASQRPTVTSIPFFPPLIIFGSIQRSFFLLFFPRSPNKQRKPLLPPTPGYVALLSVFVTPCTFPLCRWSGWSLDSHWLLGSLPPASFTLCRVPSSGMVPGTGLMRNRQWWNEWGSDNACFFFFNMKTSFLSCVVLGPGSQRLA